MSARRQTEPGDQEINTQFHHNFHTHFSPNMDHFESMGPMDSFNPGNMDFTLMQGLEDDMELDPSLFNGPNGHYHMDFSMFQNQSMPNVDPSQVWHSPDLTPDGYGMNNTITVPRDPQLAAAARSAQSNIVNHRDQVTEQFGQITPPDEDAPDSFPEPPAKRRSESKRKIQEEDLARQSRTQRARNAANKRHSKAKVARRDSMREVESEDDEEDGDIAEGKSTNMQREKNRLAAAKCRAKKKATSEEMQESHREGSKTNSYLQREVRELRDQKAFLRNTLLQHEPGVCKCHAIHRFNMVQAQQLAMGVGAMINQPLSPSQDSVGSAMTPGSDMSMGKPNVGPSQGGQRRMSMSSRGQSFNNGGSNFNMAQMSNTPGYPPATMSPSNQSMQGGFTDFLDSPQDGHSGFQ